MATLKTINIATDFSKYPAGRLRCHAKYSGEALRDDLLAPALREYEEVTVNLSGVVGYAASFLEEAFGGLVRECGFDAEKLRTQLKITGGPKPARYRGPEALIREYIEDAGEARRNISRIEKLASLRDVVERRAFKTTRREERQNNYSLQRGSNGYYGGGGWGGYGHGSYVDGNGGGRGLGRGYHNGDGSGYGGQGFGYGYGAGTQYGRGCGKGYGAVSGGGRGNGYGTGYGRRLE